MFNPFRKKGRFSDYVIDLGKLKSAKSSAQGTSTGASATPAAENESGLGFLGTMANAAENTNSSQSYGSYGSSGTEDTGRKLGSISEKLFKILDRLDLLEHKMDRVERKIGLKEEY
ncbi:MAG: hypothetical protein V1886_00995 [archaeon]